MPLTSHNRETWDRLSLRFGVIQGAIITAGAAAGFGICIWLDMTYGWVGRYLLDYVIFFAAGAGLVFGILTHALFVAALYGFLLVRQRLSHSPRHDRLS